MKVFGIKCNKCGDFIYSRTIHDFHYCTCESCAIDGGQEDYYKIIGNKDDWEIVKDVEIEAKDLTELYNDWNYRTNNYGIIKDFNYGKTF